MDTLRWLHLSDVHFSDGESYEIKRMRDSIIDKMKEVFEKIKWILLCFREIWRIKVVDTMQI